LKPKLWDCRVDRLHTHHLDLRCHCRRLGWRHRQLRSCGKRPCRSAAAAWWSRGVLY